MAYLIHIIQKLEKVQKNNLKAKKYILTRIVKILS